ncbi:uncharacterized protein LOC123294978 [Chrysoperla carnea]|uniref:uncharacterized protein LOC123294978 n=1 Tax=Chrysoperla carnea TaxID=189513 RepID=UPI001D0901A3|nr:uncharacterized protein LOC123294978 [Chrysoperla carnea]
MIGAMPAVAVRHERRRQEKRGGSGNSGHHQVGLCSRPSQLYVGGVWPPPHSPCSTSPSPGGHHSPDDDQFREYYVCGKISALQLVVGSLLLGAIVLVVGLVQLTPGADAADHRFYLMGAGTSLITLGLALTAVRCCCMHCPRKSSQVMVEQPQGVSSIDMLVKDGVITSPSELDYICVHQRTSTYISVGLHLYQ